MRHEIFAFTLLLVLSPLAFAGEVTTSAPFGGRSTATSVQCLDWGRRIMVTGEVEDSSDTRWVTMISDDRGATWQEVDRFIPHETISTFPVASAASGDRALVIGTRWDDFWEPD